MGYYIVMYLSNYKDYTLALYFIILDKNVIPV